METCWCVDSSLGFDKEAHRQEGQGRAFLAQLAATNTQVQDNDQDDNTYLSHSLHLCIKHGCPFCHHSFPQSPSLLLAILVDNAVESWVEYITAEGFMVYFPENQESTADLQAQICSAHVEEANDERLKQLGMSCPICNPECHTPSPLNPSMHMQHWPCGLPYYPLHAAGTPQSI
jgi:hypothetical protein